MSITSFMNRIAVQTVVYWEYEGPSGYGGVKLSPPVEIKGRWEDVKEIVKNNQGEEILSQARVWLLKDVKENGYMWLGEMDDSAFDKDVKNVENAMRIIAFGKVPGVGSTNEFVRKAHLNMGAASTV